nr:unnamed protein product [Digitaria exilis]
MAAPPPPLLLILILLLLPTPFASSSGDDLAALLALKAAVTNDPSGALSAWSGASATSYCRWRGVTCNPSSLAVEAIDLPGASLSGTLPADLPLPPRLRRLDLAANNFSGSVPDAFLASSTLRYLDLSFNGLSGPLKIPLPLGNSSSPPCAALTDLRLAGNLLVDQIPAKIAQCRSLRVLDLSRNVLEGAIPRELGRLAALRVLDVSRNSLTDRIPVELANCRELAVLVLTNLTASPGEQPEFNAFVGGLPTEVLTIPALEVLWAPRANLDGRLPLSRNGTCALRAVNLGHNYIAGVVPPWFGECHGMAFLDLSSNSLEGSMPAELAIGCLTYLNVSANSLSGQLLSSTKSQCPSSLNGDDIVMQYYDELVHNVLIGNPFAPEMGNIANVALHDFSNNDLSGPLPSLTVSLDRNNSYGQIPGLFGDLAALEVLDLSRNSLTGSIPIHLTDALRLQVLRLDHNRLSGSIPPSFSDLTQLTVLDVSFNNLSGDIPNLRHPADCGGFGATYKAELAPGFLVAVKRLAMGRFQGLQQFDAEIRTLGRIRHKNLVTLIGYHIGDSDTFLIYNFLSGGNLETFIHEMGSRNVCWTEVHKIAVDVAQALAFLHCSCTPRIIHRDIKPSNILLDEDLNAYLSDFGLARLIEVTQTHATTDVAGSTKMVC